MRSTIAIIVGFVLLIFCSLYVTNKINTTSENILAELSEAEVQLRANDWEVALLKINETYEQWSVAKNWWAMILNHSTINNIEISYLRLQQYAGHKDQALAMAELKTLLLLLKDVPESEALRLNNIL
ncbi:MAG: DUF4363 family protein [Desulfitobacteriia bacterium]